jgi:hypothetical protein
MQLAFNFNLNIFFKLHHTKKYVQNPDSASATVLVYLSPNSNPDAFEKVENVPIMHPIYIARVRDK